MEKIILFVDKEDYIKTECKDYKNIKEVWLDPYFPPNSKYLYEIIKENMKIDISYLFILTKDNYISLLKSLPDEIDNLFNGTHEIFRKNLKFILAFSWFSDISPLYKIELYLYKALEETKDKNLYTFGVPLCYLVNYFDRSIEYQLIKKYGYEEAMKRLPWIYKKSEQCNYCFKKHLCFGVPEFYYNRFYDKRPFGYWEGVIDLYPIFE